MTIVPLTLLCLSHMFKGQLQGAGVASSNRFFSSPIQRSWVFEYRFHQSPRKLSAGQRTNVLHRVVGRRDKARSPHTVISNSRTRGLIPYSLDHCCWAATAQRKREFVSNRTWASIRCVFLDDIVPFGWLRIDVSRGGTGVMGGFGSAEFSMRFCRQRKRPR